MTHVGRFFPLLVLGCALNAQSWEVYVASGVQSPSHAMSNEAADGMGQRMGKSLALSADFRQLSLGGSYNLLSYDAFRLRVGAEASVGGPSPDLVIRYATGGFQPYYVEATGSLKLRSINPGISVAYVAPWAGEYGLGLEARMQRLSFESQNVVKFIPSASGTMPGVSISRTSTDPFLTAHATFVQQYTDYAVFARFTLAFNLKSATSLDSMSQEQFGALDATLLDGLMPRKEVKISVGARF